MLHELYLLIGVLIGFVYTLAAAAIVITLARPKQPEQTTLGDLRSRLSRVQEDVQAAQDQLWAYGSDEEEKSRRWRLACIAVAGKAVSALQSCWLERGQTTSAQSVYDELLLSLKSVGVEEIVPGLGGTVQENDRRYRIRKKEGCAPYKVSQVLYPGYNFRPRLGKSSESQDGILLEPALIDVVGQKG